jgi:hypothetical protein
MKERGFIEFSARILKGSPICVTYVAQSLNAQLYFQFLSGLIMESKLRSACLQGYYSNFCVYLKTSLLLQNMMAHVGQICLLKISSLVQDKIAFLR